jgi:hypothetical protein
MMEESLKNKAILVYDFGTFVSVAERLGRDFGKVYYYSQWKNSFPQAKFNSIGEGLENVERVENFFDYIDMVDCFLFPDVLDGDLQLHLESIGKKVWGSRKGEQMELNRIGMKQLLKDLDCPVGPYEVVKGTTQLRQYLKDHQNIWVKINCYRGDFETFKSVNFDFIETKLAEVEANLGILKDKTLFICENDLPDKVELAYDGYCVDGVFPSKSLCGIELKDKGYVAACKDYNLLPKPITDFNTKIAPILKQYRYRNFFHPEMRIGKDGLGYVIDPAARFGSPPNEVYQELFTNFSQIIWNGANGICIDPIPMDKFAVEVIIHCNWAERNWLPVLCPEKYKHQIKFRNVTVQDGVHYIVPQYLGLPEIGSVIAIGQSMEYCIEQIKEICDSIKGFYLETPIDSLDQGQEEIEKFKSFGYNLFE